MFAHLCPSEQHHHSKSKIHHTWMKEGRPYLRESLLAGTAQLGYGGDDFARSTGGHHLGGEDGDGSLHAGTAGDTCTETSSQ